MYVSMLFLIIKNNVFLYVITALLFMQWHWLNFLAVVDSRLIAKVHDPSSVGANFSFILSC